MSQPRSSQSSITLLASRPFAQPIYLTWSTCSVKGRLLAGLTAAPNLDREHLVIAASFVTRVVPMRKTFSTVESRGEKVFVPLLQLFSWKRQRTGSSLATLLRLVRS